MATHWVICKLLEPFDQVVSTLAPDSAIFDRVSVNLGCGVAICKSSVFDHIDATRLEIWKQRIECEQHMLWNVRSIIDDEIVTIGGPCWRM